MTLIERIASMTDTDLASLRANAMRLSAGDGARKREAADLLPALEAEIGARKARVADVKAPPAVKSTGKSAVKSAVKSKRRRSPA